MAWHTPATIRTWWASAPKNDDVLNDLLAVAKDQILAPGNAPRPLPADVDTNPPANFKMAQLLQVRALWGEMKANNPGDGEMGLEGQQIEGRGPRQLGTAIMKVLRPFREEPS